MQRVDGVVLLDWSDRSLERQIQLGAKTGDIDINLARFEMNNYRSNIIPAAQFFDQQSHLHIVGQKTIGINIVLSQRSIYFSGSFNKGYHNYSANLNLKKTIVYFSDLNSYCILKVLDEIGH